MEEDKYILATCGHCGKATDISLSKKVRELIAIKTTLTEQLILTNKRATLIHRMKNGQVMALHKMIAELWLSIPQEKKNEIYIKQQELRDTLKFIKRKYLSNLELP